MNAENAANKKAAQQRADDPLLGYNPARFPGAIPLPGTAAALRIGQPYLVTVATGRYGR